MALLKYVFFCIIINTEGEKPMGLPKTVRFDDELEKQISNYLKANDIKFTQLINMAVAKFISEPQTIELKPVDTEKFMETAKKAYKKHKHAMDKLK